MRGNDFIGNPTERRYMKCFFNLIGSSSEFKFKLKVQQSYSVYYLQHSNRSIF